MNNKVIIVATLILAVIFVTVLALLNSAMVSGTKSTLEDTVGLGESTVFSNYVGTHITGDQLVGLVDQQRGCYIVYIPQNTSVSTHLGNVTDSSGKKWTLGYLSNSLSLSENVPSGSTDVYFKTERNLPGYTSSWSSSKFFVGTYADTAEYTLPRGLSDDDLKLIQKNSFYIESTIKHAKSDTDCGLVLRIDTQ